MLKPETKKLIKEIAEKNNVNVVFAKSKMPMGGCYLNHLNRIIIVEKYYRTESDGLSVLFHELGHHYCYNNNKWPRYHKQGCKITGKRAEIWVDKWAEKELKKHFPGKKYKASSYRTEPKKETFKFLEDYRKWWVEIGYQLPEMQQNYKDEQVY